MLMSGRKKEGWKRGRDIGFSELSPQQIREMFTIPPQQPHVTLNIKAMTNKSAQLTKRTIPFVLVKWKNGEKIGQKWEEGGRW